MNKKHHDLKEEIESCYKNIKYYEHRIKEIRNNECKHPKTEKSLYSWAPGHVIPDVELCVVCGKVIKVPEPDFSVSVSTS